MYAIIIAKNKLGDIMATITELATYPRIIKFLNECKINYCDDARQLKQENVNPAKNKVVYDMAIFDNELLCKKCLHWFSASVDKLQIIPVETYASMVLNQRCKLTYKNDWQCFMLREVGEEYYTLLQKHSISIRTKIGILSKKEGAEAQEQAKKLLDEYTTARKNLAFYEENIAKKPTAELEEQ